MGQSGQAGPALRTPRRASPSRLGEYDRLRAGHVARSDADEVAVLPLACAPLLLADVGLHVDWADDGIPWSAVGDGVEYLLAIKRAGLLDCLLENLQAGISDRARPSVRCMASDGLLPFIIVLCAGQVGVPTADAEDALDLVLEVAAILSVGGTHGRVEDLWVIALRNRGPRQHEGVGRITASDESVGA